MRTTGAAFSRGRVHGGSVSSGGRPVACGKRRRSASTVFRRPAGSSGATLAATSGAARTRAASRSRPRGAAEADSSRIARAGNSRAASGRVRAASGSPMRARRAWNASSTGSEARTRKISESSAYRPCSACVSSGTTAAGPIASMSVAMQSGTAS
ncbi:hypothetical protein [Actinomadura sp. CNU-125]|uniref:hypothetical protein n=1 Tax=Actinomadura sp. CNU-125 TaxID=1904961 RepID=UPI001178A12F